MCIFTFLHGCQEQTHSLLHLKPLNTPIYKSIMSSCMSHTPCVSSAASEGDPLLPKHASVVGSSWKGEEHRSLEASKSTRSLIRFRILTIISVGAILVLLAAGSFRLLQSSSPKNDEVLAGWTFKPVVPFGGGHGFKKPFEDKWADKDTQEKKGWIVSEQHDDTVEYDDDFV